VITFRRSSLFVAMATVMAVLPASSSAAQGGRAGWELSANTYPTNLGHGVDEVQEIAANGEEASFVLGFEGQETAPIPIGANASVVQAALESLPNIGAGNVGVSEEKPNVYVATFINTLGSTKVATLSITGGTTSVRTLGAASGTIAVDIFNIGAEHSKGPITIVDKLPAGVKAKEAGSLIRYAKGELPAPTFTKEDFGIDPLIVPNVWDCTGNGPGAPPSVAGATVVTCEKDPEFPTFWGGGGTPTMQLNERLANPQPVLGITVEATGEASGLANNVSISGGGAVSPASTQDPVTISPNPAPGGLVSADAWFSNADGTIDTQAGSHPYTATFVFHVATALDSKRRGYLPGSEIRDLATNVPPGLVGDLHNMPQCRQSELITEECPPGSMVGVLALGTFVAELEKPVFNMVPPPGEPAELGFVLAQVDVAITFHVQSGGDNSIVARVNNIPQRETFQSILTLWGVPEDETHNRWRGVEGGCTQQEMENPEFGNVVDYCARQQKPIIQPILTLPTSCGEPQPFAFRGLTGWQEPNAKSEVSFLSHEASGNPTGFTGCEALGIEPKITTTPDTSRADSPSGVSVEIRQPLGGLEEPQGLSTADIKNVAVTLPEGFVINPGQAAGLTACGASESALTTQGEREHGEENDGPASCPQSSKVGTVTIKSPLIESAGEKQLDGNVYVLQSNPPDVKLLVAGSADGVNVKEVVDARLNEQTGQVTGIATGIAQLPFSDFKLTFNGGPQAALVTPAQCGTYTTNADFTPWSTPFAPDFFDTASFAIAEGAGGAPCPSSPLPFAPTLTAGSTNDQAGAFTGFSLLLQRADGQQRVEKLQFTEPAGLSGLISQVPLCPEPQASQGTCDQASQIGHAIVQSGPGSSPLTLPQPGGPELPIYLTGPYKGAPFGLSIKTPVVAGPFNLGSIVTRARIDVDPGTAQITITTDPLPQIVKGVPTDIRSIYSVIDRPDFLFNPTNCSPQEFTGTATSAQGATASLSSRFGIGGCRELPFKPRFSASTQGKFSKANGASLTVKVTAKPGEANIHKVSLQLPIALPARLTTLQKACTEAQFDTNPAGCPEGSFIGTAIARTPVLTAPLVGPVILVSHGGAAFPDVEFLLQGEGVRITLDGKTDIKKGITYSRFEAVPDAPISSFETVLPEGPHSALAANGNLCTSRLVMPTELVGQNGAAISQNTKVGITGCAKKKSLTRAQKLTIALKACHKKHNHAKRAACERKAHKRYGPVKVRRGRGK
jgi:hypothetical protein